MSFGSPFSCFRQFALYLSHGAQSFVNFFIADAVITHCFPYLQQSVPWSSRPSAIAFRSVLASMPQIWAASARLIISWYGLFVLSQIIMIFHLIHIISRYREFVNGKVTISRFFFCGTQAPETICQRPGGPGGINTAPDTRTRWQRLSRSGLYSVQVNQIATIRNQNPGPAGPRPDTQSGPRGRAGAQLGDGGKDAAGARRGGPQGRRSPERSGGAPRPGSRRGQPRTRPRKGGHHSLPRARRRVVSALFLLVLELTRYNWL